jgi:hypothetical protein
MVLSRSTPITYASGSEVVDLNAGEGADGEIVLRESWRCGVVQDVWLFCGKTLVISSDTSDCRGY